MAEYIDKEKVLDEINQLKSSIWFNEGKNEIADYQHCMYLERKEGVETVTDLCVKQQPTADVVERSKIAKAIEEMIDKSFCSDLYNDSTDDEIIKLDDVLRILKKHIGGVEE